MSSPTPRVLPSDNAVRREVLDTTQSWMLQAPAGSGKTELLMQRYLACLATVEQPESVLAITFTRKAAAEMRSRILDALQGAQEPDDARIANSAEHERQSLQLARAVLETSRELGWNILDNPARLQVRTLDSFCEAVAQRAPFKGLLGGVAQVTEDAQPLYEQAAQRVIDLLAVPGVRGDAVETLLVHLDNDVGGARDLLATMLAQRDQWMHFLGRSDAFDAAQQESLRSKLDAALTLSVEQDLAIVRAHCVAMLSNDQSTELFRLMRYATAHKAEQTIPALPEIDSIAASAEVLSISSKTAHQLSDIAVWPEADSAYLAEWRAICEFLLTSDANKPALRKTVDKRTGFPADIPHGKNYRDRCIGFLKELSLLPESGKLFAALNRIRRLPDPRYTDAQWQFMRALLEVLPLAAASLKVVFSEQATLDFAEYAQRALDAIGAEGEPTELGLQLGYRIRHILVDEFQDTSRVQVELLARLIKTWDDGEQCSAFYVGDPMQSIYSFRQADVAIYQQARTDGVGGNRHSFRRLKENFRSQRKLVDWFNSIFPAILCEDSDLINAIRYPEPAEASRPELDGAAVFMKGFAEGNREGEARHLAECIQRELALPTPSGEKPVTIAVLVRSRTHLPELVDALHDAGIDYRAVKTDRLSDRPLVRDLDALRSALTDLADRTAWLAVLRAPWCGLSLADLVGLCHGDERSTVRELLQQRTAQLSESARLALARCVPVLEAAAQKRGRVQLRELVECTWLQLGGPACTSDREQGIRDAEAYFCLLAAQSTAGMLRDAENFSRKLHELFAPADTRSGIRVEIMPIHQAKGLEWDVVFLPALERHARQDEKRLLYWRLRHRAEQEFLLLGPMEAQRTKDRKAATIEGYLRDIAADCSREELKRLFYVAATRAAKRLYLSASVPAERRPNANSFLRLLWDIPDFQEKFAPSLDQDSDTEAKDMKPELLLRRLPTTFVAPGMPEPLRWSSPQRKQSDERHSFEWVGDLLPRVGVVAHKFLQRCAMEGVTQWNAKRVISERPAIAAALSCAGVMRAELEQAITRVSEALRRSLEDERGRWLLSPHQEHQCEFAVSAVIEGRLEHVRIDRTFIEDGTRWLIDYKITEQLGGDLHRFVQLQIDKYRPDMQRYVRALRRFDQRPVKCALYLPLLGEFCPVEVELS